MAKFVLKQKCSLKWIKLEDRIAKENVMTNYQITNISPKAKIGQNVTIEPFTTIYGDVEIGDNTWIGSNVVIMDGARIGSSCKIFPGAIISAESQDLKYNGEYTLSLIHI